MLTTLPSEKNRSVDVTFAHAIMHQKHLAQSGHSTRSAVDIFNTLCVFPKEPIRKQEIELECMNDGQDDFWRVYYGDFLWKSIGLSSINYACSVWFCNGTSVIDKLETYNTAWPKQSLRHHKMLQEALYGKLRWQSLYSVQNNHRV